MKHIKKLSRVLAWYAVGYAGFLIGAITTGWVLQSYAAWGSPEYVRGNMAEIIFIPYCVLGGVVSTVVVILIMKKFIKRIRKNDPKVVF